MPISKASSSAVAPGAKGDLVVGNATNDSGILAVGSANQVLTVDSSTATGLKWAAAGGGGMTLIATGTGDASSAVITFSSIPSTHKHLMVVFEEVRTSSGDQTVKINYNGSTAGYDFRFGGTNTTNDFNAAQIFTFNTVANANSTNAFANGVYWIYDYAGSHTNKIATGLFASGNPSGDPSAHRSGTGRWRNTAAINEIAIGNSGSFAFGTSTVIKLYGVS